MGFIFFVFVFCCYGFSMDDFSGWVEVVVGMGKYIGLFKGDDKNVRWGEEMLVFGGVFCDVSVLSIYLWSKEDKWRIVWWKGGIWIVG